MAPPYVFPETWSRLQSTEYYLEAVSIWDVTRYSLWKNLEMFGFQISFPVAALAYLAYTVRRIGLRGLRRTNWLARILFLGVVPLVHLWHMKRSIHFALVEERIHEDFGDTLDADEVLQGTWFWAQEKGTITPLQFWWHMQKIKWTPAEQAAQQQEETVDR
jgi:hypothetical protein